MRRLPFHLERFLLIVGLVFCTLVSVTPVYAARAILVFDGPGNDPRCQQEPALSCLTNLEDAIEAANQLPEDPDDPIIIKLGTNTFAQNSATAYFASIVITRSIHLEALAPDISINGNGSRPITIDGSKTPFPINVRISGFEITGGDATNEDISPQVGGAILIQNASPTIENNLIQNNTASTDQNDGFGGGIAVIRGSPTIRNNIIRDNTAATIAGRRGHGGGISLSSSAAQIENNLIYNNVGGGYEQGIGGGVYVNSNATTGGPRFVGNRIIKNTAFLPGANGQAGGIYSFGASPSLINTVIANNSDTEGSGGVLVDGGNVSLIHATINANTSTKTTVTQAGVLARVGASVGITNTIVSNHSVGVYAEGGTAPTRISLTNVLFHQNTNDTGFGAGGVIQNQSPFTGADTNPSFANTSAEIPDYRITLDSQARNRGVPTVFTRDADNRLRLGLPDLGAYEYSIDAFLPLVAQ